MRSPPATMLATPTGATQAASPTSQSGKTVSVRSAGPSTSSQQSRQDTFVSKSSLGKSVKSIITNRTEACDVDYESHPIGSIADKIWDAQVVSRRASSYPGAKRRWRCRWSNLVLYRDDPIRLAWSALVVVLLLYTGIVYMYRMSFIHFRITSEKSALEPIHNEEPSWDAVDEIVYVLFVIDLFVYFFFTYEDYFGYEINNHKKIAWNYLTGYFTLNLISCLPETLVWEFVNMFIDLEDAGHVNQGVRILRLQRLSRFSRVLRLTQLTKCSLWRRNSLVKRINSSSKYTKVVNLLCGLLWTAHILACGWYLCAALHADRKNTWVLRYEFEDLSPGDAWMRALYFILTVFTTVGFGDIHPVTNGEISYVLFVMFVGAIVHSIIIGEVINVVTSHSAMETFIEQKAQLVESFSRHTELPEEAAEELRTWVESTSRFWMNQYYDKEEMRTLIMGKYMPRDLMGRLPRHLFQGQLLHNKFLLVCKNIAALPPRLPMLVALASHRSIFMEGEMIYQANDVPFNVFLVLSGCVAYVAKASPEGGLVYMGELCMKSKPRKTKSSSILHKMLSHTQSGVSPNGQKASSPSGAATSLPEADDELPDLYPYQLFPRGTFFGDVELLLATPRLTCARCEEDGSAIIILNKKELLLLADEFPVFGVRWRTNARYRAKVCGLKMKLLRQAQTHTELATKTIQSAYRIYRARRSKVASHEVMAPKMHRSASSISDRIRDLGTADVTMRHALKNEQSTAGSSGGEVQELKNTVELLRQEVLTLLKEVRSEKELTV